MNVLVLAAGVGSRLQPALNSPTPKSLIKLGNENLLERQVRQVPKEKSSDVVAVVGENGDCWNDKTRTKFESIVDNIVINQENKNTESGYSFLLGLQSLSNTDTLVLLGDTVLDDNTIAELCDDPSENVALAMALETKVGTNHGAYFSFENELITGCGFDIDSNYAATGIMHLSGDCVRYLSEFEPSDYKSSNLAPFIDLIAKEKNLSGFVVNNSDSTIPTRSETLDLYRTTDIKSNKRKNKIVMSSVDNKRIRDRVDFLLHAQARHPNHFPKVSNISLFTEEPSYDIPNYLKQGYNLFSESLQTDPDVEKIVKNICKFLIEEFGEKTTPIPGLYKNTFLPKISTAQSNNQPENGQSHNIVAADTICVNNKIVPTIPTIRNRFNNDSELIGRLEPNFIKKVHGDLRPSNVLVNNGTEEFIFLNPRGQTEIGTSFHDPLYDISKLLAYIKMEFLLHEYSNTEIIKYSDELTIHYDLGKLERIYNNIEHTTKETIKKSFVGSDSDWQVRLNMLSGLFLISGSLSQNFSDIEAAIMYGCGAEYIKEGMCVFKPISDKKSNIVNINTESDLKLARHIFAAHDQ